MVVLVVLGATREKPKSQSDTSNGIRMIVPRMLDGWYGLLGASIVGGLVWFVRCLCMCEGVQGRGEGGPGGTPPLEHTKSLRNCRNVA